MVNTSEPSHREQCSQYIKNKADAVGNTALNKQTKQKSKVKSNNAAKARSNSK
jgi:hypothetical protein